MRQIVLDTETTGLDANQGHKVIEIGALEVINRRATGHTFHAYLNPDRTIDAGAAAVHGITNEFLTDKPRFAEVADAFLAFVKDAELIIHNAPFDVGFLDAELARLGHGSIKRVCSILDTLKLAKELHPGQKNNLDALCKRYEVDNSGRSYHGALLDAQLLSEVYLAMTRGQETLSIETRHTPRETMDINLRRGPLRVLSATADETQAHVRYLQELSAQSGETVSW